MFVLSEFKDVVRITSDLFHLPFKDAIIDELNSKLANKVVLNVGLCIALYDIIEIKDSVILPGDGSSYTEVRFRYIVFRPFIDELIIGKIKSCSSDGVIGFFDDIIIQPKDLQHKSRFDEIEQAWIWEYDLGDGTTHDLYMDIGEKIRFRVTSEIFQETSPDIGPPTGQPSTSTNADDALRVAYKITATICEPGLGLLSWWNQK
ncbi:DNA-directed RNA polymerase III subunit RPC8-like isoform X2 [Ctenocephalides felis]|uniref:DNA-directed RNA polymerase III subunit RPC8-like isoform X2 n=1 Tax=Ctenocephalides felis TaxID=7515 RepID=UPI000E6E2F28|nr:DNA-directed RNA polymerase III subunit RPC8-like isoform X2 [Ctenocephalides felis]